MKIVIISDTHEQEDQIEEVPEGDVLIHCGDITGNGSLKKLEKFAKWMQIQPHKQLITIFGNHDRFDRFNNEAARKILADHNVTYLQDSGIEIDGLYFYGSPFTPNFFNWSWMLPRGKELANKWSAIPSKTDVLIVHGPAYGILDEAPKGFSSTEHTGCQDLLQRIKQLHQLKLFCNGHIHYSYSSEPVIIDGVKFVNAAICNEDYEPINKPVVVEIETPQEKIMARLV